MDSIQVPNCSDFRKGCKEFKKYEKRDAMYKVATFLLSHFWRKSDIADIANGLGVLLLTWNQAFYRYGVFDFDRLEKCIEENFERIDSFRKRDISSLNDSDERNIKNLFNKFLDALQINSGKSKGKKSPVSVAKALHILAPNFFPLWDDRIAKAYNCYYSKDAAGKYVSFCKIIQTVTEKVKNCIPNSKKPILKQIDEYNYSRYTKGWIK